MTNDASERVAAADEPAVVAMPPRHREGGRHDRPILQAKGVTKRYGGLTANSDIDFAVNHGEIRGVIGPNGAGKTTFFKMLTCEVPPTSGQILFDRKDITGTPASRVAHLGLARSYQRTTVFPGFSLFDNVWVAAFATGKSWKGLLHRKTGDYAEVAGRARQALQDVGLEQKSAQLARELSHGEQRQLELAIALAAAPRVLLLDEPAAGVPSEESERILRVLENLPADIAILIIEHDMDLVFRFARRITVLVQGEVLLEGTPEEIAADRRVHQVYLGEQHV